MDWQIQKKKETVSCLVIAVIVLGIPPKQQLPKPTETSQSDCRQIVSGLVGPKSLPKILSLAEGWQGN